METDLDDDKSSYSGKDLATDVDSESNSCTNLSNVEASPRTSSNTTPRRDLPILARTCDRHGISDRAAAAIASAVLQDFGIITPTYSSKVIDKNKIRRPKQKK